MNTCPQCGTTYTDASLRFCLADGAELRSSTSEAETLVSGRREALRVEIPEQQQRQTSPNPPPEPKRTSFIAKLLLALFGIFLVVTIVIGGAGAIYYFAGNSNKNVQTELPPSPTPTATVDAEKERLKKELADLQKKLDERAATNTNKQRFPTPDDELDKARIATVNSPGDGFLALRTEPGTETGERIAQIPHGSRLEVISCEPKSVKIGVRTGKWCLIEWNGRAGWVFDAWLTYR